MYMQVFIVLRGISRSNYHYYRILLEIVPGEDNRTCRCCFDFQSDDVVYDEHTIDSDAGNLSDTIHNYWQITTN